MVDAGPATLAVIAHQTRDTIALEARRTQAFSEDLAGECVRASFALRDALRAAGIPARAYAGYFLVDEPSLETCFCGTQNHDKSCFLEPHVWVDVGDLIVDITVVQFAEEMYEPLSNVEIRPPARAQRWLRRLAPGTRAPTKWRAGEVHTFRPTT